jgi:hypothetical protein
MRGRVFLVDLRCGAQRSGSPCGALLAQAVRESPGSIAVYFERQRSLSEEAGRRIVATDAEGRPTVLGPRRLIGDLKQERPGRIYGGEMSAVEWWNEEWRLLGWDDPSKTFAEPDLAPPEPWCARHGAFRIDIPIFQSALAAARFGGKQTVLLHRRAGG